MFNLPRKPCLPVLCALLLGVGQPTPTPAGDDARPAPKGKVMRVAAAQPKNRTIDFRLTPAEALARVDASLDELEKLVHKAGDAKCDALALPEDTLGLGKWEAANPTALKEVLPEAVKRMLDRLGKAAAKHRMYLVCCNDTFDPDGTRHNTAFLMGRDGKEVGRYHKVQPTITEARKRGDRFPVFSTADLGGVGMLICYDMVFPEAARCLALGGADIIFHPTLGGAAIGDDDISRAAFRTRAVENFVYVVVSQRGGGSMIISPQGKILVEGKGPDDLAIVDIDPFGDREGRDAFNHQKDMRARLFRERNPAAYGILTDPNPPVLKKIPSTITREEAARIAAKASTVGEDEFKAAESLARSGKTAEAIAAFEKLRREYPGTWIDRVAGERLATLRQEHKDQPARSARQPYLQPPAEYEGKLGDYRSVLKFDDGTSVRTAQDWPQRRREILQHWHGVMGSWPAPVEKPQIKYQDKEHVENFTRHKVEVEMAPGRLVGPQYLLIPDGQGPFPAVLVTWYNSADSAGLNPKVRGTLDFGYQLAQRGFVTLCVGNVGSVDARMVDGKTGVQPLSYLAYVAANCRTALASLPQVDPRRIGIMGHSFGGKWAMLASCLEEKFACAVWVDPGIVWNEKDPNANFWEKWYLGYEFDQPAERQRRAGLVTADNPRTGAYKRLVADGRDLHELHALMAPRPFLVSGGAQDRPEHWTALNHTIALNQFLGHTGRVGMTMRDGHTPTPESNRQAFSFLEHFLSSMPAAASGIASKYPGDVGIEKDPRVVFAENFEAKDLAGVTARWETASGPDNLSLVADVPAGSGGKQALLVTHVGGKGTGGQLYRRLKPGYDKLHARFYVKFDPDCAPIHHFGTHLGGYNPPTAWPQGFAGVRPAGDKTFTVGVEPFGQDWVWDFYTYWCEMRGSPPKGQTWGNTFIRDPKLKVERGRWICVELMVKMNDIGDANGEMALWIDGKPVGHLGKGFPKGKWVYDKFSPGDGGGGVRWDDAKRGPADFEVPAGGTPFDGFRWRTAKELNLNYLWLYAYITRAAEGHVSRIWFDDIVVATEYIGPHKRGDANRK